MKKILLSLSVVGFLCAGNFGDFDGFDDRFDRFMNGPKKTKESKKDKEKAEQKATEKATEKEEKADEKKSEKDSKKDKESTAKNITKSFDRSFYYPYSYEYYHSAEIKYGFDSNGNLNSIAYPLSVKKMTMSEVEYKKFALSKIHSAVKGTLRNNGELITLKTLISATNKAGANKAIDNLKAQLDNVLALLEDYNVIEVVDEKYDDEEKTFYIEVKIKDDIIKKLRLKQNKG